MKTCRKCGESFSGRRCTNCYNRYMREYNVIQKEQRKLRLDTGNLRLRVCKMGHTWSDEHDQCQECRKIRRQNRSEEKIRSDNERRKRWLNTPNGKSAQKRYWENNKQKKIDGHRAWLAKRPFYSTYRSIIDRCENPKSYRYRWYGGRGIKICNRWRGENGYNNFANFVSDIGPRPSPSHSLDRINNDGDYCPENIKWSTPKEQARNRRSVVKLTVNGITKLQCEWLEESGLSLTGFLRRKAMGLTGEALIAPPKKKNKYMEIVVTSDDNHLQG